ncbi:MAG: hypothetical protein HZA95_01025, partial [Candidatus Vogelbacteria bacterium]|nr:hypothetical protein [Candidatus Vogelbacteria bacterium]
MFVQVASAFESHRTRVSLDVPPVPYAIPSVVETYGPYTIRRGSISGTLRATYYSYIGGDGGQISRTIDYRVEILKNGVSIGAFPLRTEHEDIFGGDPIIPYPRIAVGDELEFKILEPVVEKGKMVENASGLQACTENPEAMKFLENVYHRVIWGRVDLLDSPGGIPAFLFTQPTERQVNYYSTLSVAPISASVQATPGAILNCRDNGTKCVATAAGTIGVSFKFNASSANYYHSSRYASGGACYGGSSPAVTAQIPRLDLKTKIISIQGNRPPNAPTIRDCPRTTEAGVTENFTIQADDPDGDRVQYLLFWDGESTYSSAVPPFAHQLGAADSLRDGVPSGQSYTTRRKWSSPGGHTLMVKAQEIFEGRTSLEPTRRGLISESSLVCDIVVGSNLRVTTNSATDIRASSATLNGNVLFDDLSSDLLKGYLQKIGEETLTDRSVLKSYLSSQSKGIVNRDNAYVNKYLRSDDTWDWWLSLDFSLGSGALKSILDWINLTSPVLRSEYTLNQDSNVQAWFEWGEAADLSDATETIKSRIVPGAINTGINGLTTGTKYYFRAVAQRGNDSHVYGRILNFRAAPGDDGIDICKNIEGVQTRIPVGMRVEGSYNCVPDGGSSPPILHVNPLTLDYGTIPVGTTGLSKLFIIRNDCSGSNCAALTWRANITNGAYTFLPSMTGGNILSGNKSVLSTFQEEFTTAILTVVPDTSGPIGVKTGEIQITSNALVNGTKTVSLNICLVAQAGDACPVSSGQIEVHTLRADVRPTVMVETMSGNRPYGKASIYGNVNVPSTDTTVKNWFRWWTPSAWSQRGSGFSLTDHAFETTKKTTRSPTGEFEEIFVGGLLSPGLYHYQALAQRGTDSVVLAPEILEFTIQNIGDPTDLCSNVPGDQTTQESIPQDRNAPASGSTLCLCKSGTHEPAPPGGACILDTTSAVIDIGLRYTDGTKIYAIAVDASRVTPTSPLRITKGTKVYSIPLVNISDPNV